MGTCNFCGHSAGFLKTYHQHCLDRHDRLARLAILNLDGIQQAKTIVITSLHNGSLTNAKTHSLKAQLDSVVLSHALMPHQIEQAVGDAVASVLDEYIWSGVLTIEQEGNIALVLVNLGVSEDTLRRIELPYKLPLARALRDVIVEGKIPSYPFQSPPMAFNFQKTEQFVWVMPQQVAYWKEKTRRQRITHSVGASVRVAKGVYVRTGGSRGYSVENTAMEVQDVGVLAFTTKHIYFGGARVAQRIPYSKIVSFQAYGDALEIHRDSTAATTEVFQSQSHDAWFVYNLATNLAARSASG